MKLNENQMTLHSFAGLDYLSFRSFEETGLVRQLFSTRHGGVSVGPFASMDLSFGRGDDPEAVRENYRRICAAAGIYPGNLVCAKQVHGTNIVYVDQRDRGKGVTLPNDLEDVDGLITDRPQVALVTFHADCVPLFFLDPVKKVIGLAHAGWRGTVAGIGGKMVRRFRDDFGSDPADILAGIGPSVGPCCFEVGPEVADRFREAFPEIFHANIILPGRREEKNQVDLWKANAIDLMMAGITRAHLSVAECCTCCQPEEFYSHRKTGNARGSMISLMELK